MAGGKKKKIGRSKENEYWEEQKRLRLGGDGGKKEMKSGRSKEDEDWKERRRWGRKSEDEDRKEAEDQEWRKKKENIQVGIRRRIEG